MGLGVALLVGSFGGTGCLSRSGRVPSAGAARAGAAAPAPAYDWTRGATAALDLDGGPTSTLSAVVAPDGPGAGWLIAGTRIASDGTTTATVWTSATGLGWVATALAGIDGRALAATAWGPRTVVVGSVGSGASERAAVWIASGPGRPFTLVPSSPALLPVIGTDPSGIGTAATARAGTATTSRIGTAATSRVGTAVIDAVAAGTQGVFATGVQSGRPAMWYSTDGADWVELHGATQVLDAGPDAVVTSMLVTSTAVLAAGTVQDGTHTDGAVWTSPDGMTWHREVPPDQPFSGPADHRIDGLALDPKGAVVAVGGVRSGSAWLPASWISPDGNIWSQSSEAFPDATRSQPAQGGTVVRAVTATGSGLLAVGGSSTAQRLWVSGDGQSWTEAPLPAGAAQGSDWSADIVAEAGPTAVIIDTGAGQPRVLVRYRGAWQEVSTRPALFGPVAAVSTPAALVTEGSRLLLAVDVDRPGPSIGPSSRSAVVLSSRDGVHWQRLSEPDALSGAWVDSMSVISGSLVAAGTTSTPGGIPAAAVWTSPTGQRWRTARTFESGSSAPEAATTSAALGSMMLAFGSAPNRTAAPGRKAGIDAVPTAQVWSIPRPGATDRGTGADLDATPSLGEETVLGSCSDGRRVVVVGAARRRGVPRPALHTSHGSGPTTSIVATSGSPTGAAGQAPDGTMAVTWSSAMGTSWTTGAVSPLTGAGSDERMVGCAADGAGFVAWGQTAGPRGGSVPALWISSDGTAWTLQKTPALDVTGAAPLTALAASGSSWVAVGGGQPAALAAPWSPGSGLDDPVMPGAAPTAASGADGAAGVWSSSDAGTTWDRVATTGPAWASPGPLSTNLVRPLGAKLVVAGQIGSGVAVWVGTPA